MVANQARPGDMQCSAASSRRVALQRLFALAAAPGSTALLAACGGAGSGAPSPVPAPPPRVATSLDRLKAALRRAPLTTASRPVDVSQGLAVSPVSSLGSGAVFYPSLVDYPASVDPLQPTLLNLPQVWGFRRDRWEVHGGFAGYSGGKATFPVALAYRAAATLDSNGVCGLHFIFDGSAFEILFAGSNVWATLIADGQYMAAEIIHTSLSGGVPGAALSVDDTLTRFDFGSAATRHVSVYAVCTRGPAAIVMDPNDHLQPWDRSGEPSVAVMADSYGGGTGPNWRGGPFLEAAARLGIPHLDIDAVGGTGYWLNAASDDLRNAGNAFRARLPSIVDAHSDLFLTAGGLNDNNAFAQPPTFPTAGDALAGFNAAVAAYYRDLRVALPGAVLASVGPWAPNASDPTYVMARSKADTIKAALQTVGGPWIFLDNLDGSWVTSTGAQALPAGPWQTGTGTSTAPNGTGNGDLYMSADGVHPNQAGFGYLGQRLASDLRAALLAM